MFGRSQAWARRGVAVVATLAVAGCSHTSATGSATGPSTGSGTGTTGPSATSGPSTPVTTPSPTETAPVDSECVSTTLAGMSLAQRAGQVLMIGVPATSATSGVSLVRTYQLGGIFLSGRSTSSVATIRSGTSALAAAASGPALLIATDQEGGAVQVLQGNGFGEIPAALTQGSWNSEKLASTTRTWGAALASAGINLDLAPVADTVTAARAPDNPPIGVHRREYGQNSAAVSAAVTTVVQNLAAVRVMSAVKHFPGLGRVRYNTDKSALASDPITSWDDIYLQPFTAGMMAGASAVMISSAHYPQLDPHNLAAFSTAVISELLRYRMGWDGVVISDDLGQAKAVASVPTGDRATRFIAAGGDLVLSVRPADARTMQAAIMAKARSSASFAKALEASVTRILLTLKSQAGLLTC